MIECISDRRWIGSLHYSNSFGTQTESTETICSCVCVQVSSLLWMRRERRGVLPLRPLCLGNMAAGAQLRGEKRISLAVTACCPSQSSAVIHHDSIISLSNSCVCVEAQSSSRPQVDQSYRNVTDVTLDPQSSYRPRLKHNVNRQTRGLMY